VANTMRIGFRLANFKELQALLSNLPAITEKKVVGVALERAARPIEQAARRLAAKDTGALRASITHTLRQYPKKTVVIIGPDRGYYEGGKRAGKGQARSGMDRPANYAHLVEFGFNTRNSAANATARKFVPHTAKEIAAANAAGRALPAAGRRTIDHVPARPFLRPAVMQGEAAAAREFEVGMTKGLEREIKKLNRKIIKSAGQAA
jgi:HK97 gp10 family phage protein